MDGRVFMINPDNNMVAARTNKGEYTVFQVLDRFLLEAGDLISGKLEAEGRTKIVNLTKRVLIPVVIKATNQVVAHKTKQMVLS